MEAAAAAATAVVEVEGDQQPRKITNQKSNLIYCVWIPNLDKSTHSSKE